MTNFGRESQVGSNFVAEQVASVEVHDTAAERLGQLGLADLAHIEVSGHGKTMTLLDAMKGCDEALKSLESTAADIHELSTDLGLTKEQAKERVQAKLYKRIGEMATENNSPDVLEVLQKKN